MSTAVYGASDDYVVQIRLAHTTAASFGQCRHFDSPRYPRRFWWRNGSETARHKYAHLWTSGPIFWAAAARTNVPSLGRFWAVSLSKIQFCGGQTWKFCPCSMPRILYILVQTCLRYTRTAVFIPLCVHTAVSGYYSCKFSRSTMLECTAVSTVCTHMTLE
jgi:hypothetical protein